MKLAIDEREISTASLTIGQMIVQYFRWKDVAMGNEHSRRAYHHEITRLMKFVGENNPVDALNRFSLYNFALDLKESGLAPASRNRALYCARDLVRWAHGAGIYEENFAIALKMPHLPKTLPQVPTETAMRGMLEGECPTSWPLRDRCIAELLYCSLRVCEVVAIELGDILDDELQVKGDGRRERKIFLTPSALEAIAEYLPTRGALLERRHMENNALFVNQRDCGRLTVKSVHRIIKAIAHAKGLPKYVSPVKLRGAYATHMLDRGAPLSAVSQLLGHENLSTIMHYVGAVSPKRMRESYDKAFKR
jgi:integrase/recombinase XerC